MHATGVEYVEKSGQIPLRNRFEYGIILSVGVDDGEVPPVPIPNTAVKLTCAEDSWLETACENR